MFGFFKKRKKKDDWQEIFEEEEARFKSKLLPVLQAVAENLPDNYSFLKKVFASQLIRNFGAPFVWDGRDWYAFGIDQDIEKKFRKGSDNYKLQNIRIFANSVSDFATLEIHIHKNIPGAFSFSCEDWDFDLSKIDTTAITEYLRERPELKKWSKIIGKIPAEFADRIDLQNGFEIELDDVNYFTIFDFGESGYIGVREIGAVYEMFHGKGRVEKIFDSPKELYKAIRNGSFDFEEYYNSRT